MARGKTSARRGRGRPRKNQSVAPKKEEEPRYVLAKANSSPPKRSPESKKSTGKVTVSSASKKTRPAAAISKFAREAAAQLNGSSEFDSPVPAKKRRGRSRQTESESDPKDEEEEEALEDESEEDKSEQEVSEVEENEEEERQASRKKTRGSPTRATRPANPEVAVNSLYRLSMQAKVQRLRSDPRFTGIKPETLERVVQQFQKDNVTPSVIINTTVCKPVARRTRVAWTGAEVNDLCEGVAKHGTSWSKILADPHLNFNERTQVDLKDKWRNLNSTRVYSELPIRRFILVNEHHEPVLTDKGYYHVFNNRWPADAAVKVATKDFIYPEDVDSVRVYLREIPAEGKEGAPLVHVFDVSRKAELARNIPKFQGMGQVFVGEARKVCTERLLTRQAVFEDFRDASRM